MSKKKLILGIDVGIKNFAVCMLEPLSKTIKYWKVYDLGVVKNDDKLTVVNKVLATLKLIPEAYCSVYVEAQPGKNRKMDYIEMIVLSYYSVICIPICRIKSQDKFKKLFRISCPTGKRNYKLRKDHAVSYVNETVPLGSKARDYFDYQEKKDDLADAYCICLLGIYEEKI